MARILITCSSDGLAMVAEEILAGEHQVTLHARNSERASEARRRLPKAESILVGDLSRIAAMRSVAEQANATGKFDAMIHNVGVGYRERHIETGDGLSHLFAINVLAPYSLTALTSRPDRHIYLSSAVTSASLMLSGSRVVGAARKLTPIVRRDAGVWRRAALAAGKIEHGGTWMGAHENGRAISARQSCRRRYHSGLARYE